MSFKVAVASNDGQKVNEHFGRAMHFLIFELDEPRFKLVEVREIESPHCYEQDHQSEMLTRIAKLLADCNLVLASQIGPGARNLLSTYGIKSFVITGLIDRVLSKLATSHEVKNYLKDQKDQDQMVVRRSEDVD